MKKIRKAVVLCLLLALTVSALTACGDSKKTNYEVLVNDTAGKPVAGVTIQFCSDTECIMGTTNDKGIAAFDKEAGSYTIHVFKVPEGYAPDNTEYPAPTKPGQVVIVLK